MTNYQWGVRFVWDDGTSEVEPRNTRYDAELQANGRNSRRDDTGQGARAELVRRELGDWQVTS